MTKSPWYEAAASLNTIFPMRRLLERPPLAYRRPVGLALIGHFNVECERPFRHRITTVIDLRHDLVAEIELLALDPGLFWRDEETHERRRSCRLALCFSGRAKSNAKDELAHVMTP